MRRLIVNSSLVGYSEYSSDNNFPYEPPSQSLWITNAERGITLHMPVMVDDKCKPSQTEWVSVPKV